MTIIKIPIRHLEEEKNETDDEIYEECIPLKSFTLNIANKTLEDLEEHFENLKNISEFQGREDLSAFFYKKSAIFYKFYDLLTVLKLNKELKRIKKNNNRMEKYNKMLVEAADEIAYIFRDVKAEASVEYDVELALRLLFKPHTNVPLIIRNLLNDEEKKPVFNEIETMIKIYLLKEDISFFKKKEIQNGTVILECEYFSYTVALCGEIEKPSWRLIQAKFKDIDIFNTIFYGLILGESIEVLQKFSKFYKSHSLARKIFTELKDKLEFNNVEHTLNGNYTNFELIIFDFSLKIWIEEINLKMVVQNKNEKEIIYTEDIIKVFESKICESLKSLKYQNLFFSLEDGILLRNKKYKSLEILNEKWFKENETNVFYDFFNKMSNKKIKVQKNFVEKKFGDKNVFIKNSSSFFCVRLESLDKENIQIRLFCGLMKKYNFYKFIELTLGLNENKNIIAYHLSNRKEGVVHKIFENLNMDTNDANANIKTYFNHGSNIENPKKYFQTQTFLLQSVYDFFNINKYILFEIYYLLFKFQNISILLENEYLIFSYKIEELVFEIKMKERELCFYFEIILNIKNIKTQEILSSKDITIIERFINFTIICNKLEKERQLTVKNHILGKIISVVYKDITFSITFENENMSLRSNNISFMIVMKRKLKEDPLFFIEYIFSFYSLFKEKIIPSFISSDYIIILLKHIINESMVLKYKDSRTCLVKKNAFTTSRFSSFKPVNSCYLEVSDSVEFFKVVKELYLRERLLNIQKSCGNNFIVEHKETGLEIKNNIGLFKMNIENNIIAFRIEIHNNTIFNQKDIILLQNFYSSVLNFDENYINYIQILHSLERIISLIGSLNGIKC